MLMGPCLLALVDGQDVSAGPRCRPATCRHHHITADRADRRNNKHTAGKRNMRLFPASRLLLNLRISIWWMCPIQPRLSKQGAGTGVGLEVQNRSQGRKRGQL